MSFIGQRFVILFLTLSFGQICLAQVTAPNLGNPGVVARDTNSFIDESIDYSRFVGRVTDKSESGKVFKIKVENNNTKFYRAGDTVFFHVINKDTTDKCKAFVRSVEDFYFVIVVQDLSACYNEDKYFRRGTLLRFRSKILARRVFEASKYREMLLVRKDDFLNQLNGLNNFLWAFDQERVKTAISYDEQINDLEKKKRKAIDNLILKKKESLVLQNELMRKLNSIDESLKYYKVERQEFITDRWNMDHDKSLPFSQRPQKLKLR
jgi:hypothetical protein